jgi:hypothetical protein
MTIQKYVPYASSQTILELLQQLKMNKLHKCYEVDTIVMQHEYTAMQLLPRDCHFNVVDTGDVI